MRRIELLTPCLQGRCSPSWATPPNFTQLCVTIWFLSGLRPALHFRFLARSRDFYFVKTLSLTARAMFRILQSKMLLVGLSGLEPPTSRLSGVRSNRLSYRPIGSLSGSKFFSYPTFSIFLFECSYHPFLISEMRTSVRVSFRIAYWQTFTPRVLCQNASAHLLHNTYMLFCCAKNAYAFKDKQCKFSQPFSNFRYYRP